MAIFTAAAAAISAVASWTIGLGALGTFAIGNFLLRSAVQIGFSALTKALASRDQPSAPPFSIQGNVRTGGSVPRSFVMGTSLTGGSLVWHSEWGKSGGTPNAYYTQVIALSDLPVKGLRRWFIENGAVTLEDTGDEKGMAAVEYRENGIDHAWVRFHDGTQTVADPFLTGTVSDGAPRTYSSSRVGTGIAYAVVTFLVNQEIFTAFPRSKFELDGVKLYDVSKDGSKGGEGSQRWGDPTTWGGDGDDLPAVQAYNLARGIWYKGQWFYGLQGLTDARLPASHWITQINKCRATIEGENGLEPMYRCAGEITVNSEIGAALEAVMTSCAGRMSEVGGVFKAFVGAPDAPIASFTDDDIVSLAPQTFTPFFGLSNSVNGVIGSFPSPDEGYVMRSTPPLYNAAYEAQDGGRRLMTDVQLPFVPYAAQVQRLLKGELEAARRARRHTFTLPARFRKIEPGDVVSWTSVRNGYSAKQFRADGVVDLPNCDLIVDLTEVDPADHGDWQHSRDYVPIVASDVVSVRPTAQGVVGFNPVPLIIKDGSSADRRAALLMQWNTGVEDIAGIMFEVRVKATGERVSAAETRDFAAGEFPIETGVVSNSEYEVRAQYIPGVSRAVDWTSWVSVTTPDVRLSSDDFEDGLTSVGVPTGFTLATSLLSDGRAIVRATWSDVTGASTYGVGYKRAGGNEVTATVGDASFELEVAAGVALDLRVRAFPAIGEPSAYTAIKSITAAKDGVAPAVPDPVSIRSGFGSFWLDWPAATEADFDHFEVAVSNTGTAPANQGGAVDHVVGGNSLAITGEGDDVTKHFWVRAVDTSGNQSDWSAGVSGTTTTVDLSNLGDSVTDEIDRAAQSALDDKNAAVAASSAAQGARDQTIAAKDLAEAAKDTAVLKADNASASAALAASAQHATVLVEGNPSFESGYDGWLSSYQSGATALAAAHGLIGSHTGRASVFESLDGASVWPCQKRIWTIEAGRKYRARGSLRAVGGNAVLYAGMACVDANEAPVGANDGLYYNLISGATYAASAGWIDVVSPVFDIDTLRAAKGAAVTSVRLVAVLNYTKIAGSKGAVDGLWLEDVTESEAAGAAADAAATSASVVTVKADEVSQNAASATTAKNEAETARSEAEVLRDQTAASATDAANSSATAADSKNLTAASQAVVERIAKSTERFDFNNGADYWVNSYAYAKAALPNAVDVTANTEVTLEDVAGEGKVLQAAGKYIVMSERATRPFIAGQVFRAIIRTRLTVDPASASGPHLQNLWLTGLNGDAYAHYGVLTAWSGLTVADGWVERTVEFEPVAIRSGNGGNDFGNATEWRFMVGLNGYDANVGGAVQQIAYVRLDEITSEKAAQGHASAAASERALASTKADEAGQSAAAAQGHSNEAATQAATATTKAEQAATSSTDANGFAQAAAASANEVQARLNMAVGLAGNWDFANGLEGWKVSGGANMATPSETYTAGQAAYCVNYSILEWGTPIPVNRDRTYKVKIRARRYQGTASTNGLLYCGLATYDKDGNVETASPGSHRYGVCIAVDLPENGGWVEYEGLFTGGGNDNHNQFRATTASAAPLVLANYNGTADDKTVIDYVTFEDVTELVAEASIRQTAIAELDGRLAAAVVLEVKSGTNGAQLELSANGQGTAARISANEILLDGSVTADQVGANEIITASANVKDAVITDAHIADLSAAKLQAGTAIARSVTVDGRTMAAVAASQTLYDDMSSANWHVAQGVASYTAANETGYRSFYADAGSATWIWSEDKVSFDPEKLYKITFRVRRNSGTGTGYMYLGLNGYAQDGVTQVNVLGNNEYGSQHYIVASAVHQSSVPSTTAFTTYVGYVRGYASQGHGVPGSLQNPASLHTAVRKIGLMALFNYGGGDASMILDSARIEVVTEEDAATLVNNGSVQIDPGKIVISGGTSLADWRKGGDETKIDGGEVSANTIRANSLAVGNRNINLYGLMFTSEGNNCSWANGIVFYTANDGTPLYVNVAAGNVNYTGSLVYIYWAYGATALSATTNRVLAQADDVYLIGTYNGGSAINTDIGRTIIDGSFIKTGAIKAVHADFESMSALGLTAGNADIENLAVDTLKIADNSVTITRVAHGTGNQSLTWTPGHNSEIAVLAFMTVTVSGAQAKTGYANLYNGGTLLRRKTFTKPDTSPQSTLGGGAPTLFAKSNTTGGQAVTISATLTGDALQNEEVTLMIIETFK